MPNNTRLFAVTSWLVKLATFLCAGLTALLVLALGVLVLAEFGVIHIPIPPIDGVSTAAALFAGATVLTACVAIVALFTLVLALIARIVDSAATGDPFVVGNAERLNRIGWLLLAIQGVGLTTKIFIVELPKKLSADLHFGFDASLSGLFAILLVFVLAQIFRRGSQMRDELEGTV